MKKKGQFYLIGAVIIAIVLMGLNYTYTYARGSSDKLDVSDLTQEIHYETKQLIENRNIAGIGKAEIAQDIKDNIIDYYLNRFLNTDLVIIYGDESSAYIINKNGVNNVVPEDGEVDASILGDIRQVNLAQQSLYVLFGIEQDDEKNIEVR